MAVHQPVFAVLLEAAMRVKPFISTEETRYYLNGVFIEPAPDGVVCVATDGHRLGVRYSVGVCYEPTIFRLPNEIKLRKADGAPWLVGVKTGPGAGYIAVVEAVKDDQPEAAIERLDDSILRVGRAFIDGTYPDWRRIIPDVPVESARSFNGNYMKDFGTEVTMRGADAASPHLVQIAADPAFVGVIMPMRGEARKLPAWLARVDEQREQAA